MTLPLRAGLAAAAGLAFAWGAYRARLLTRSGAVAGGLFAATLVLLGGLGWIVPGLAFFVLSSALSRVGRSRKRAARSREEKGSTRDAVQVLANGGPAWFLLVLNAVRPADAHFVAYLGALAAAAADTWATEVGVLAPTKPRLITTLEPVPSGTSGAVSLLGSGAALSGAFVIWLSAWPWIPHHLSAATGLLVVASGFAASFLDSLLGATVQGRHPWLDNDAVNLLSTTVGAALAWTCFQSGVFAF